MAQCFGGVCFYSLSPDAAKLFGFSELLAGLALMVLAWTIADVRYRFRVRTAPIPLLGLTFAVVACIALLTLLTDLWRAEGWLVPAGNLLTPASWQALLAGSFLFTFFTWTWFAFISPPKFGRRNAERYARTLYRYIVKGAPAELAVIADEIANSAKPLVLHATDRGLQKYYGSNADAKSRPEKLLKVEAYANDLLLLIGDRRLCRAVVQSSPVTALLIFQEMSDAKKYGICVEAFARNVVNEALINSDSFLYHETHGYDSGLIGFHRPLSQAIFSNHELVESVGTLLDPDIGTELGWTADRWEAYCRAVLLTFQDYVEKDRVSHSFVLHRAMSRIEHAASDLYKLDGLSNTWDSDAVRRLRVVIGFIKDSVGILDSKGQPQYVRLRVRKRDSVADRGFYDCLARMIFEAILDASAVTSPRWECWSIQHNYVWSELFSFHHLGGAAGRIVKFKLRRLLYDEITYLGTFANFKGARILGYCLNVMGLRLRQGVDERESRALHVAVLAWTRKNYALLHASYPRVAEACLVDGLSYEAKRHRLVKTYPVEGLRQTEEFVYLEVNPAPGRPMSPKRLKRGRKRRGGE